MGEQKQEPASGEAGEEGRAGRGPLTASWRMGGKVRTLTAGGRAFEMKRSGGTKAEKSMFKRENTVSLPGQLEGRAFTGTWF